MQYHIYCPIYYCYITCYIPRPYIIQIESDACGFYTALGSSIGDFGPECGQLCNNAYCQNYISSKIVVYIVGRGMEMSLLNPKSRNPKNLCQWSHWSDDKGVKCIGHILKKNFGYAQKKLFTLRLWPKKTKKFPTSLIRFIKAVNFTIY